MTPWPRIAGEFHVAGRIFDFTFENRPSASSVDLLDGDVVHDLVEGCGELTNLFTGGR